MNFVDAAVAAEVIRRPVMFDAAGRARRIDRHAADGIDHDAVGSLIDYDTRARSFAGTVGLRDELIGGREARLDVGRHGEQAVERLLHRRPHDAHAVAEILCRRVIALRLNAS